MEHRETDGRRRRAVRWAAAGLLLCALALRLVAVFHANVHWDEFGLLHLADLSETSGVLESGGRPGLAVALLLPFVAHCDDEVSVVRRARLLWVGITALWLAGVFVWIAQLAPERPERWRDAALGTALLALVPAVLDASLQVRTDQLALAGGAWAGALLLASRRRPAWALAAGACLGAGFLGSQKIFYVAAAVGLLAAAQHLLLRELRPGREALRLALLAVGAAAVVVGFQAWAGAAFEVRATSRVAKPMDASYVRQGLSLFEFYRHTIGFSQYRALLPSLAPHLVLLAGLAAASVHALRRGAEGRDAGLRLALAWALLALGLGVALFHAAAFSYFWMTLGLFPALAFALARGPLEQQVPERLRGLAVAGVWALLVVPAGLHMGFQIRDAQAVQRESLGFVHRNFPRDASGFQPESALFCQDDPKPFPTFYSQLIYHRFGGDSRGFSTRQLERQFREKPVRFLVQSFRLNQFPVELRRFWADNYQPYRASVFVAGRRLAGARGDEAEVDLIVPGRYRWLPLTGPQPLGVGEQLVPPGGTVDLGDGPNVVHFVEDVPGGILVLALEEPPGEAPLPFYE